MEALEERGRTDPLCHAVWTTARVRGGLTPDLLAELVRLQSVDAERLRGQVARLVEMAPLPPIIVRAGALLAALAEEPKP